MTGSQTFALKTSSILWILWGAVHLFAGIMVLASDPTTGFQAIADAVNPEILRMNYPAAVAGVLGQHAWNLAWFGVVTLIGAVWIWRGNMTAIWVTAMVGGLADLGYFIFIDLAGFAHFIPGTLMTLVSATAIVLSGWVWLVGRRGQVA